MTSKIAQSGFQDEEQSYVIKIMNIHYARPYDLGEIGPEKQNQNKLYTLYSRKLL